MALTYPLSTPTTIGIESIELRAVNAVATSQSPFTYKQQTVVHGGQRWEASVTIPSTRRDLAAEWKAMLVGLKGSQGTFLLGDPDYATPRGDVSSCVVTGTVGADSATVLLDQTGDGTIQVWPSLRTGYTSSTAVLSSPKGVFRLLENVTSWSINNASAYGISFEAVEVIT
jgi:hypothetical protein